MFQSLPEQESSQAAAREKNFGPDEKILRELFEKFWKKYPNKVAKKAAWRKYRKVILDCEATPAELIAGVERYIENKPPDVPWCHGSTWLNQGRWEDQPSPPDSHASRNINYIMGN